MRGGGKTRKRAARRKSAARGGGVGAGVAGARADAGPALLRPGRGRTRAAVGASDARRRGQRGAAGGGGSVGNGRRPRSRVPGAQQRWARRKNVSSSVRVRRWHSVLLGGDGWSGGGCGGLLCCHSDAGPGFSGAPSRLAAPRHSLCGRANLVANSLPPLRPGTRPRAPSGRRGTGARAGAR